MRSRDSRLVSMEVDHQETPPALLYTFVVAGRAQTFRLPLGTGPIEPSRSYGLVAPAVTR